MLEGCTPWPDDVALRYRAAGYWIGERLGDITRRWAAQTPDAVALICGERRVTYRQLDERADRLAAGLHACGVAPRDRVIVQLQNSVELVEVSLALFRLGALTVYMLPAHRRAEIVELCALTEATACVIPDTYQGFDHRSLYETLVAERLAPSKIFVAGDPGPFTRLNEVDAAPRPFSPPASDDVAMFLLSGGTTGTPKLIPRTHDDYAYQLRETARALGVDQNAVYLATLPIAHNAALGCPGVLGTLRAGGRIAIAPTPSPDDVFPLVEREHVTLTTLMPSLVTLWLDTAPLFGVDVSRVLVQVGGAKLPVETARRVRTDLRARLTHWFGMAEGLLSFTRLDDPIDVIEETQGRPLSADDELLVVDEYDRPVPSGHVGQLLTRGPYTLRAYYRADDHNRRAFTDLGYLRTGDLVRIHDGNMIVEGRVKDVINRGGEKVSAEEVEEHLLHHPRVRSVAVAAYPDRMLGEKTCAVVVAAEPPPTLGEVRAFLIERGLAEFKLPDRLELRTALPMTQLGKVDKAQLRATLASSTGDVL